MIVQSQGLGCQVGWQRQDQRDCSLMGNVQFTATSRGLRGLLEISTPARPLRWRYREWPPREVVLSDICPFSVQKR